MIMLLTHWFIHESDNSIEEPTIHQVLIGWYQILLLQNMSFISQQISLFFNELSLLSLMPLWVRMSSTHRMKNKSSDCTVISHSMKLTHCNIVHLSVSGRISPMFSFMMANDPPCWPHSDPVDYCTSFDDCSIFRLNDYAVRLYVYVAMCVKCQIFKHCP